MGNNFSKSQYLRGLQCNLSLWYYKNDKNIPRIDSVSSEKIMELGAKVGLLAQEKYPFGQRVITERFNIKEAVRLTNLLIKEGASIIYEATAITPDGNYCRIDILKKVNNNEWDLIEVKSSTEVKEYYYDDLAFQRLVFEQAGYEIRKSILMHINNEYVREGDIDVNKLFIEVDLTKNSISKKEETQKNIDRFLEIVNDRLAPTIKIGDHCKKPYYCDYKDYCWKDIPSFSVYKLLAKSKAKRDFLVSQGIVDVKNVPDDFELSEIQMVDYLSCKTGKVHIQKNEIKEFLDELVYPLYYLDYETVWPAIPLFNGSRPFQQIPFQFSLHIQNEKGARVEHIEFLNESSGDPRAEFVKKLVSSIGDLGSVIVYNQSFEQGRNKELMEFCPEYKSKLESINSRVIDLLVPFRKRLLYSPSMNGSASIKSVLPAFVKDLSYNDLEIKEGGTASELFLKTILETNLLQAEKDNIYKNLKEYCGLDTLAMVRLIQVLYENI